jgi:hypothetical protein
MPSLLAMRDRAFPEGPLGLRPDKVEVQAPGDTGFHGLSTGTPALR